MVTRADDLLRLAELLRPRGEEAPAPALFDHLPACGRAPAAEREAQRLERSRGTPKYEFVYRQSVSAEDVFLQMSPRTPLSASCERLVLGVELPGESLSAMELDLTERRVRLAGLSHQLELDLPHEVDPNDSTAEWDPDRQLLTLTLRIVRELDYVNF